MNDKQVVYLLKFTICRIGWQAGDTGRANVAVQVRRPAAEFPFGFRRSDFCSIKAVN